MDNLLLLNANSVKLILQLNDELKKMNNFDMIFKTITNFLEKEYKVTHYLATINDNLIYSNFELAHGLKFKDFSIELNSENELKVSIFYENDEKIEKVLENNIEVIKVLFNVISQTVYSKFLEFKLDELSLKDCLTGLYNRQYIDEYLKTTLPLSNRERKKMAFIKIGIDHFKAVIDEFDYNIGDKVLKELAKSVQSCVRKSDLVARIEADEFFVVLHNVLSEENAIKIANKIVENFKNVQVIVNEESNQTLMKTICTGVSIYPDDAQKIEDIFRSSDIALYEARNKGRSQTFKFKKEETNTFDLF